MAARNRNIRNPNKPELVAIYRLEFYKNKNNWKLTNEQRQKSAKAPLSTKIGRNNTLNETYSVDPVSDVEKEQPSLNNAFIHETPTEELPPPVFLEPPPPPPSPSQSQKTSHPVLTTPGPFQDTCFGSGIQAGDGVYCQDAWGDQGLDDNLPLHNSQDHPRPSNTPTDTNPPTWTNQGQPVNLQWLLKTASMGNQGLLHPNSWQNHTKTPVGNYVQCNQPPWNNLEDIQDAWKCPPSENTPRVAGTPGECGTWNREDQPCPEDHWKRQDIDNALKDSMAWTRNAQPDPRDQLNKQHLSHPEKQPSLWNNHPVSEEQWENQVIIDSQKVPPYMNPRFPKKEQTFVLPNTSVPPPPYFQDSLVRQRMDLQKQNLPENMIKPLDNIQMDQNLININSPSVKQDSGQHRFVPALWFKEGMFRKEQDWTNEEFVGPNAECQQNVWVNQAWQEKQALWDNGDKDWCGTETVDVPDGVCEGDGGNNCELQIPPDQCTLKPPSESEPQTLDQIIQYTDLCLRKLVKIYRINDWQESESFSEQYQAGNNDSSDFVREAHDVAHSSETDPNETTEWVWSLTTPSSLPTLSSRRLAAAIRHVTTTLRGLLNEQRIRDQLRAQRVVDLEEYPTRDTEVFKSEYILSGSHLPRSTRHLVCETGQRLIKIDMGRPYRL